MKKLLLLLVLVTSFGFSQEDSVGNYTFNYKEYPDNYKLLKNEQWYKLTTKTYVIYFSQSPIGIKKSIEHLEYMLYKIGLKLDKPTKDTSFLSSIVKSINDYENLDLTIKNEMSEIKKSWNFNNEFYVFLFLHKDNYEVSIMKIKD